MSVKIITVASKKDLRAFIRFPLNLYKDCPYYVPNLYQDELRTLSAKNPMSRYCKCEKYLAVRDGVVVGRVMAIINEIANSHWGHREVRFGWMDFIDDAEVSRALLEAVISFGRRHGMKSISGPLGFTDFDSEGCVVEGFDDISSFALKYNYPYYASHFEALGMTKVNDWLEYRIFVPEKVPEKVSRGAQLVTERYNLHLRKLSRRIIRKEAYGQKIFDLINRTYCDLFDFTVLPPEVIDSYVETYLGLLDLRYVTVVESSDNTLVAVAITMPSIVRAVRKGRGYLFPTGWWHLLKSMYFRHEEALELLLIAVDPAYSNKGVYALMFNELIPMIQQGGFRYGESNAEMESNNRVQNIWNLYDKEIKRRRRVFSMEI